METGIEWLGQLSTQKLFLIENQKEAIRKIILP